MSDSYDESPLSGNPQDDSRRAVPSPDDAPGTRGPQKPAESGESEPLVEILSSLTRQGGEGDWSAPSTRRQRFQPRQTVFTVQYAAGQQMAFRVSGAQAVQGSCGSGWAIDFGALNLQMRDMGRYLAAYYQEHDAVQRDAWRRTVRELGSHMYDGLLAVDEPLAAILVRLRRLTRPPHRLTLAFAGPDTHLSVPYELLHDVDAGVSLALLHPLCRQVTGAPPGDGQTWREFFTGLQQRDEALRVLLISSGAEQVGATDEVSALEELIESAAVAGGLRVTVDLMLAGDATSEQVRARLRMCPYHIVHYVGQAYHDPRYPGQGGLMFAARHDVQLGQVIVNEAELAALLAGSATRLVYLSASVERSALDSALEAHALRADDDFDLLRAVVRAGVPYAVGLRWYTPPAGRQRLAEQFYTHLLAAPFVPELAMLRARQAAARADARDESWMTPVLIAQNVDLGGG